MITHFPHNRQHCYFILACEIWLDSVLTYSSHPDWTKVNILDITGSLKFNRFMLFASIDNESN